MPTSYSLSSKAAQPDVQRERETSFRPRKHFGGCSPKLPSDQQSVPGLFQSRGSENTLKYEIHTDEWPVSGPLFNIAVMPRVPKVPQDCRSRLVSSLVFRLFMMWMILQWFTAMLRAVYLSQLHRTRLVAWHSPRGSASETDAIANSHLVPERADKLEEVERTGLLGLRYALHTKVRQRYCSGALRTRHRCAFWQRTVSPVLPLLDSAGTSLHSLDQASWESARKILRSRHGLFRQRPCADYLSLLGLLSTAMRSWSRTLGGSLTRSISIKICSCTS